MIDVFEEFSKKQGYIIKRYNSDISDISKNQFDNMRLPSMEEMKNIIEQLNGLNFEPLKTHDNVQILLTNTKNHEIYFLTYLWHGPNIQTLEFFKPGTKREMRIQLSKDGFEIILKCCLSLEEINDIISIIENITIVKENTTD